MLQSLFALLILAYMYLPIVVLAVYSFNNSAYSATWEGFTLRWYERLLKDERLLYALQNSLMVALGSVMIAAILGTMTAVGLAKYKFWGRSLYQGVAMMPVLVPDIALAVATLVFLAVLGLPLSLGTIVAAHVVFCLAYVAVVVATQIAKLDPHLEEAAIDLGATPWQALIQVVLPELMPGIVAGCLLAFVLSMDDFLISSFTAGAGSGTLPMEIFSRIRTGVKPDINALSVLLLLVSGAIALVAEFLRMKTKN